MPLDEEQKRLAEELLFSGGQGGSFVKALFFGAFDAEKVFPYPDVDSTEKEKTEKLLEKVRKFSRDHIDAKEIDRHSDIPFEVVWGLGKLGILGMTIPCEYGGLGMSQYAYCRVEEELSRVCGSTALFVNAHQSVGLKALLLFGTEEQKKRYLPPLAKGDHIAAFSLTEPGAGSDASGVETRAEYQPEKKAYVLNGQKQWTTNGSIAKMLTVMAQTRMEDKDSITAFIVTPEMPGFKVLDRALEKVGMRGSVTSNLAFEDLEVPEENILGPKGKGLKVCLTVLDYGRTTFGATCTGAAKVALEKALSYAKERHQFHRPLASFPLIKKKLVQMAAMTYAIEATTYMTAGLVDRGEEDFMLEAAILKVFASESLWQIIYESMQIYGGKSFFQDEPLERMMRDARLNMIGEGANEVLRAFIGAVGMRDVGMQLKKVSKKPFSDWKTLWGYATDAMHVPKVPVQSNELAKEAKMLGKAVKQFGFAVKRAIIKYREEVVEKQLVLDRLATSVIALYTTTAVLSRLDRDLVKGVAKPNDVAIAKWYCHQAMDTVQCCLGWLFYPGDDEIEALSDQLTGLKKS